MSGVLKLFKLPGLWTRQIICVITVLPLIHFSRTSHKILFHWYACEIQHSLQHQKEQWLQKLRRNAERISEKFIFIILFFILFIKNPPCSYIVFMYKSKAKSLINPKINEDKIYKKAYAFFKNIAYAKRRLHNLVLFRQWDNHQNGLATMTGFATMTTLQQRQSYNNDSLTTMTALQQRQPYSNDSFTAMTALQQWQPYSNDSLTAMTTLQQWRPYSNDGRKIRNEFLG